MSTTVNRKKTSLPKAPSAKIARLLESMQGSDGNQNRVRSAWLDLEELVIQKGQWTKTSLSTLNAALEALGNSAFPECLLWLSADILLADCYDSLSRDRLNDLLQTSEFKACLELVSQQHELILAQLGSSRSSARAGAATLLGATFGLGGWEQSALESKLAQETAPLVRSELLCALQLVDQSDHWAGEIGRIAHEGDPDRLVYGTATLSWLRQNPQHAPIEVIAGIEAWLSSELEMNGQLRYLGLALQGQQAEILARVLVSQGTPARSHALSALVELGRDTAIREVIVALGDTLDIILGRPKPGSPDSVIPARQLDTDLRLVADGLVDTWVYPSARWMPAAGKRRRRWLGLDAPTVLEEPAPDGIDSHAPARPLWEALRELDKSREPEQLLPPAIANALDPRQQWWVALEGYCGVYGGLRAVEWSTLTACGCSLKVDDGVASTIHLFCREALARQRLVTKTGSGGPVITRLLFLPLVRSGRSIPEEFYALISFSDEAEEREILATIPRDRIAGLIRDRLDATSSSGLYNTARQYLAVLDAVPSREVCDILVGIWDRMPDVRREDYRQELSSVAKRVPELEQALAQRLKRLA